MQFNSEFEVWRSKQGRIVYTRWSRAERHRWRRQAPDAKIHGDLDVQTTCQLHFTCERDVHGCQATRGGKGSGKW